jgi:hypothetical protein
MVFGTVLFPKLCPDRRSHQSAQVFRVWSRELVIHTSEFINAFLRIEGAGQLKSPRVVLDRVQSNFVVASAVSICSLLEYMQPSHAPGFCPNSHRFPRGKESCWIERGWTPFIATYRHLLAMRPTHQHTNPSSRRSGEAEEDSKSELTQS